MSSLPSYRILVIDDNPSIHDDIKKVLQRESKTVSAAKLAKAELLGVPLEKEEEWMPFFEVDSAFQGKEGLELIKKACEEKKRYALSFVDVRMPPGWDGVETIEHIWKVDRDVQIVICTAHSDYSWSEMIKRLGNTDQLLILKKPFDSAEIRQLACSLARKWSLGHQVEDQLILLETQVNLRTAQIKATLESTSDGVLSLSQDKVLNYNLNFVNLWEIPEELLKLGNSEKVLGCLSEKLHHKEAFISKIQDLNENNRSTSFDILQTKDGKIIECYSQPQIIEDRYEGRVWCFRDITKSKELEDELAHQATHDSLTDLPNRALLYDRIQTAIANANQSKTMFALLFFDLDRFKLINDTMGHVAGDELLKSVSMRLKPCINDSDTFARLGGDEFVMIISQLKKEEDTIVVINKCLEALKAPFYFRGHGFYVKTSIGISIYPKDGKETHTLLKNADMAMYQAKEMKTGGFRFYTNDLNKRAEDRLLLETNLRKALENNEFILYYQPQINLKTRAIIGVEALLRWNHPKLGIVPPLEFIPLAEETGLIIPIGEWVLRAACQQYKNWQKNGLPPITLAINLSGQQLKQNNIIEIIQGIIEETKFDSKYLEIEFTESSLISDVEAITNKVISLKKLGVSIAIDDFGTGYSSLSYLKLFPIDKIKIDQSFVHFISDDPEDTGIILAIIAIAKSLKLRVLAEGVETKKQFDYLLKEGCQEAQGYYFCRPLCAEDLIDTLRTGKI